MLLLDKLLLPRTTSLKRPRSRSSSLENDSSPNAPASPNTNTFLAGPALPPDLDYAASQRVGPISIRNVEPATRGPWGRVGETIGRPTNRRRLTDDVSSMTVQGHGSGTTSAQGHARITPLLSPVRFDAGDPFGYMSAAPAPIPVVRPPFMSRSSSGSHSSVARSTSTSTDATTPPPLSPPALTLSCPLFAPQDIIAPHAYLTFGAGHGQRALHAFCSDNPLPGLNGGRVPYYVPT